MREHVRGKERYFRTKAGDITLDWGSNGADYKALDFSYVAAGKGGNMRKIYGQVRRNDDGESYDTYDIMAGRRRIKTQRNTSVENAIRAHIAEVTGNSTVGMAIPPLPPAPNTIRSEMTAIIEEAVGRWDFCLPEGGKWMSEEQKAGERKVFAERTWDCGKFFVANIAGTTNFGKPVGVMNVETGIYSRMYRAWREFCKERHG